ncbi:hypothetical protein [Streptomyces sp. BE230]|uniref:hypothetical protein n=1 Tax=Streptomyces sp. BE230 TaxID=3002526 RepID=UPI002ED330C7|nr:hypothetical protein [Streptomyces sp. BE230]
MEDLTAGNRTTAVAAATVMLTGMAIIVYGVITNDLARSLGGACLTMTALTLIALVAIRRWITNTSAERARLAEATREVEAERLRYLAGQAAQEQERARLRRDIAAASRKLAKQLEIERARLAAEFEEKRAQVICDTFAATYRLAREDRITAEREQHATVVQFPEQETARARDRGRISRT